jgi:hypothetical protein
MLKKAGRVFGDDLGARLSAASLHLTALLYFYVLYALHLQAGPPGSAIVMFLLASGMAVGLCAWLALVVDSLLVALATAVSIRALMHRWRIPVDVSVPSTLIDLIRMLEQDDPKWGTVHFMNQASGHLERLARIFEKDLPRQLEVEDVSTAVWVRKECGQIASAFRSLQRWIVSPFPDTRERLLERLVSDFAHAARGEWSCLERVRAEPVALPDRWHTHLFRFVRQVAIATFPAIGLCIFHTSYKSAEVPPYVMATITVWTIVQWLVLLDPSIGAKVSGVREVMQYFSLPGKERGNERR